APRRPRSMPREYRRRAAGPASAANDLQRDVGSGQDLAYRAGLLGLLGELREPFRGHALGRAPHGQLAAGDPEAASRVRAEADLRTDVEELTAAAGVTQQRRELHGEAGTVSGGDELFRAGHAARVLGRPPGEADLVPADARTHQLRRAGAFLKAAGPRRAGATAGHRYSFSSGVAAQPPGGAAGPLVTACHRPAAPALPGRSLGGGTAVDRQGGPVMKADSSLSRNAANAAISSGLATRPVGFGAGPGRSPSAGAPSRRRYKG